MESSEEDARVSGEGAARSDFSGGDFVWGKIKNHPWWPGQVHDSSCASPLARTVRRREEQSFLVAYFGDRTFAWCEPSQLKHFADGFDQMARQSTARSFVGALKEALDSIQLSLESEILLEGIDNRTVVNAGIEEGTAVPEGRVKGMEIGERSAAEMVERLRGIACDVSAADWLEAAGIRAWFAALSRWMGWPLEIVGNGEDSGRSSHRRRMRSVADLIAQTEEITARDEDVICVKKLDSSGRQQRKKNQGRFFDSEILYGDRGEGGGSGRRERKRSRFLSPPYVTTMARARHSFSQRDREADRENLEEDGETAEAMLHELCRVAIDFTYLNGDLSSSSRVRSFFDEFRRFVRGDDGSKIDLDGVFPPNVDSETPDHSRASSGWKFSPERRNELMRGDAGDGGVSKFEKSISGFGNVEIHQEEISEADDDRSNFNVEGESEPGAEFEPMRCDPGDGGVSRSEKSISGSMNVEIHQERGSEADDDRSNFNLEGESKPAAEFELMRCDPGDGGVSRSEEKSISGSGKLEIHRERISVSDDDRSDFNLEPEPEPADEFEASDRSPASTSIAQGKSEPEKFEIQPTRNSAAEEAAIQLTLGSGPARTISGQKYPLDFIKKSLEAMISALRSSFPPGEDAESSESLDPEARENLIGEMNRLMKNVDGLLVGSSTSVSS